MSKIHRIIFTIIAAAFLVMNLTSMAAVDVTLLALPLVGQAIFACVKVAQHFSQEIQYRLGEDKFLVPEQLTVALVSVTTMQMASGFFS